MNVVFSGETEHFSYVGKTDPEVMKLFLDLTPKGAHLINRDNFLAVFAGKLSVDQLHLGVIDDILSCLARGEAVVERRIAKGVPAEKGADGKILLLVKKFTGEGQAGVNPKGFANFSELHLFDNITKDQVVGRLYGPKAGTPGMNAIGVSIPAAPGKPLTLNIDKSIVLSAVPGHSEYQQLTAGLNGLLGDDSGKLAILETLHIKDDLDRRYGNIDFIGSIVVTGSVTPGLSISAKQGIEIAGTVQGGELISADGDITVKGYLFGGEHSRVVSGRNVSLGVAQQAHVQTLGDIAIRREATECSLRCGASLLMPGAALVGGKVLTVCGVEVKNLGNEAGLQTIVRLASDVETRADYIKLLLDIETHERAMHLIALHLGPYATKPDRIQLLKMPHRAKLENLLVKLKAVEKSRLDLVAQQQLMLDGGKRNQVARVNVLGILFPGVEIRAGDAVFTCSEVTKGPLTIEFVAETQLFEQKALTPLECAFTLSPPVEKKRDGK